MGNRTYIGPVLVVEFSTGWAVLSDTREVLAAVETLEQVVDLCNWHECLIVAVTR